MKKELFIALVVFFLLLTCISIVFSIEDKNIKTLEIFSPFTLGLPGLILTVIMRMIGLVG